MQTTLKFICCSAYDFINQETGERISGVTCKCFDPTSKEVVKVKTDRLLDEFVFADDITVNVVIKGKYVSYQYSD